MAITRIVAIVQGKKVVSNEQPRRKISVPRIVHLMRREVRK